MQFINIELIKNDEPETELLLTYSSGRDMLSGAGRVTVEDEYQKRVVDLVKELRDAQQLTWEALAAKLAKMGEPMKPQVLANKVNRGRFQAGFAVLILQALGTDTMHYPKPPNRLKATKQP
jgi:hypothetical protein